MQSIVLKNSIFFYNGPHNTNHHYYYNIQVTYNGIVSIFENYLTQHSHLPAPTSRFHSSFSRSSEKVSRHEAPLCTAKTAHNLHNVLLLTPYNIHGKFSFFTEKFPVYLLKFPVKVIIFPCIC